MLKKYINDSNSIFKNSMIIAAVWMIIYASICTIIILYVAESNPEMVKTAQEASEKPPQIVQSLNVIRVYFEFFWFGTITEFFRRKKSTKFTCNDSKTINEFNKCLVPCAILYPIISLISEFLSGTFSNLFK